MIRRFLWNIERWLYVRAAKPILFLFSPDSMHIAMTKFSVVMGNVTVLRWFVQAIFRRRPNEKLTQQLHGIEFSNPVGLAAGFDKNGEIMPTIRALGFGFGTVGSVTADQCDGNPRPWFYRLPKTQSAVINAGLANDGSKPILKRIANYSKAQISQFPIVLSVARTNSDKVVSIQAGIDDYVTTIKRAKSEKSISMIEINISCPNTHSGEPFTTNDKLERLLTAIDKVAATQPIYIKMPLNLPWDEFRGLLDVIMKHQVVGITVANLMKDRSKIKILDYLPDNITGNFSGKPAWEPSNELIRRTYQYCGDKLTIIGAGGIFSADDAYTKIKLGANLVEVITGVIFSGPQLAAEISDGLVKLLKRDGFTHISQAVGIDSKR